MAAPAFVPVPVPPPSPQPGPAPAKPSGVLEIVREGVILAFANDQTRPAAIVYTAGVLVLGGLVGGVLVYALRS